MTIKRAIIGLLSTLGVLAASPGVQAATLLPPGKNCFNDANGDPLAAGTVGMYIPTTMTAKDTWQDSGESSLNSDPIELDSAGCAIIYGSGVYRQIVKDVDDNTIWDQLTASTAAGVGVLYGGTSTGSANAQIVAVSGFTATDGQLVSFTAGLSNTTATTINAGTGGIPVRYDSNAGPVALTGNEIRASNVVMLLYSGGFFHLIDPGIPQFPISLSSSDVTGVLPIVNGGTGSSTTSGASTALAPSKTASFSADKASGNQGFASTTFTKVTFTTEIFDNGNHYDTSLSRWTPPAGVVLVTAGVTLDATFSVNDTWIVAIYKNGTVLKQKNDVFYNNGAPPIAQHTESISVVDSANGTDYYEVFIYENPGGTPEVLAGANVTYFMGTME